MSTTPTIFEQLKRFFKSPDKSRTTDRDITTETISRDMDAFRSEVLLQRAQTSVTVTPKEPLMRSLQTEVKSHTFSDDDKGRSVAPPMESTGDVIELYGYNDSGVAGFWTIPTTGAFQPT